MIKKKFALFFFLLLLISCERSGGDRQETSAGPDTLGRALEEPDSGKQDILEAAPEKPALSAPDYDTMQWADLGLLDSTIRVDMKYATVDNFVNEQLYECGRCFVRPRVAVELMEIHHELQARGLGLKMWDCYRPRSVQWRLWEKVPDPRYVSDPRRGSMHNRGAAVDLTIVDSLGRELNMGTPFDFFGREAYHNYVQLPDSVLANRKLLKDLMESHGFKPTSTEWWHYHYAKSNYELSDMLWKCY
jgi:zinc D-Ala-D-Ala dipeptidase